MADRASGVPTHDAIYREYDTQRRLRLARMILPPFIALNSLAVIAFLAYGFAGGTSMSLLAGIAASVTVAILDLCFVVAQWGARHGRVALATNLTIGGILLVILGIETGWVMQHQAITPYALSIFTAFGIAIVLTGILGEIWTILAVTILLNLYSLPLLFLYPVPGAATGEVLPIISGTFIYQWAFAGLQIAVRRSYRRTIQELTETRFAKERAERLDSIKDQFISSVNHELRNPIMAMVNYIDVLQLRHSLMTEDRRAAVLTLLSQSGQRILALINSILDTRRIDQQGDAFAPTTVLLRPVIEAAAASVDPREGQFAERELRIRVADDFAIWGDEMRLFQILTNLLSNAAKYSAAGTPVEVTARLVTLPLPRRRRTATPTCMAEVAVRDWGLGVPADQQTLLFQRFIRLPRDLASTTIGNGLGLFLCRVLAESMAGTIRVESEGIPGEGSAFIVRLPLPTAITPQQQPQPIAPTTQE